METRKTSDCMKNLILIIAVTLLTGCSAAWHLKKAEKHILIAESKGAKWKDIIKTDTVVKDTTIFIEGSTLDDTFGFTGNEQDTVFIERKDGVKAKLSINSKAKKGSAKIECPDNIVNVPQKYYINRRITRTVKAGFTTWQAIQAGIIGAFFGLVAGLLIGWFRQRKQAPH